MASRGKADIGVSVAGVFALVLLVFPPGHEGSGWAPIPQDGVVQYICSGSPVVFGWTEVLEAGESNVNMQWYHEDVSGIKQLMAILAGQQLVEMGPFQGRLNFIPNAGIRIDHVTQADTGNYSVEIVGQDSSGQFFSLARHTLLVVLDGLPTTDGTVHAQMTSGGVYDQATGQWSVDLTCGHFVTGNNRPPYDVQWQTPSGAVVSSTHYDAGYYHLLLPQPVERGQYTCHMPQQAVCLTGPRPDVLHANVTVDDVTARLAVLEAQVSACSCGSYATTSNTNSNTNSPTPGGQSDVALLSQQQTQLLQHNADLSRQLQQLTQRLDAADIALQQLNATQQAAPSTHTAGAVNSTLNDVTSILQLEQQRQKQELEQCRTDVSNVNQTQAALSTQLANVTHAVNVLTTSVLSLGRPSTSTSTSAIAFHSLMDGDVYRNCPVNASQVMTFPYDVDNTGSHFNSTHFTAPVDGHYFFLVSGQVQGGDQQGNLFLKTDLDSTLDRTLDFAVKKTGFASILHAAVHLQAGSHVWVENSNHEDTDFRCYASSFTGFLLA